jgi:hypothetical protein
MPKLVWRVKLVGELPPWLSASGITEGPIFRQMNAVNRAVSGRRHQGVELRATLPAA